MIVKRNEYHQMTSTLTYDVPKEDIIKEFGSVEDFEQALNGEHEDDELCDKAYWDFLGEYDYDREDDVWTDRKGGYDVDYEIDDDEDE